MLEQRVGGPIDGSMGPKTDFIPQSQTDAISHIEGAFHGVPPEILFPLLDSVNEGFSGKNGRKREQTLTALFKPFTRDEPDKSVKTITERLKRKLIYNQDLPEILDDPSVGALVSAMLPHRDTFGLQLGVILNHMPLVKMPDDVQEYFSSAKPVDYKVLKMPTQWSLCRHSENRLSQANTLGALIKAGDEANDLFLMKYRGLNTALCLQDMVTPQGNVILRGNWYSPHDAPTMQAIRDGFDAGQSKVVQKTGTWAFMRAADFSDHPTIHSMDDVDNLVARMPASYPTTVLYEGKLIPRKEFRRRTSKDM